VWLGNAERINTAENDISLSEVIGCRDGYHGLFNAPMVVEDGLAF